MDIVEEVKDTLQQALPDATIYVFDPLHDGVHLEAIVICPRFKGLSLVRQHQMVMFPLQDHFQEKLHALSIKTFTPEVWEKVKKNFKAI